MDAAKPGLLMALMAPKLGDKRDPPRPYSKSYRGSPDVGAPRGSKSMRGDSDGADEEGAGDDYDDGDGPDKEADPNLTAAAQDVMSALENGDPGEFAEGLRSFVSMCD